MVDINEAAQSYTRKDFLAIFGGVCPREFGINFSLNCGFEDCGECLKKSIERIKHIKFKDDLEDEKVEDKIIKARCIEKIYAFEKDKIYEADKSITGYYSMTDDDGEKWDFNPQHFENYFEKVESQKEYTVMEIFQEKEETKFKDNEGDLYIIRNNTMMKLCDDTEPRELLLNKRWFKKKFTKVEESKPAESQKKAAINYKEENEKLKKENSELGIRINNQNIVIQEYEGYKKALEVTKEKGLEWMNKYDELNKECEKLKAESINIKSILENMLRQL